MRPLLPALLIALGLALLQPGAAVAAPARAAAAPAYVGRFGVPGSYARLGKPSASRPSQLHPFSADDGAYLYRLHWRAWGHGTAKASGRAAANDCSPDCAHGHLVRRRGARAAAWRLRTGECYGKPARFYTRVRLHFPAGLGLHTFTVRLTTGCGDA